MFFLQGNTYIDYFLDDTVSDDQPFSREELRSLFEFVYLKLPPQPLHFLYFIVSIKPRRFLNFKIIPYILQFKLISPEIADKPRNYRADLSVLLIHIVAHAQCSQEHESEYHADVAIKLVVEALMLFVDGV